MTVYRRFGGKDELVAAALEQTGWTNAAMTHRPASPVCGTR